MRSDDIDGKAVAEAARGAPSRSERAIRRQKRHRRRRRWVGRLVLRVAAALTLLLVVVGSIARTPWAHEQARRSTIEAIRTELGLVASIRRLTLDVVPFPPRLVVEVRGLALDHPEHGRVAEASRLSIRPSIGALLRGRVDLARIEIDRPSFWLLVRDGEVVNLPVVAESEGDAIELPFRTLVANRGRVYVDAAPYGSGIVEGVELEVDVARNGGIEVIAEIARGSVTHILGTETIERVAVEGEWIPSRGIEVVLAEARTPHFEATLRDALIPLDDPTAFEGSIAASIDLGHLASLPIALPLGLEGHVDVEAWVHTRDGRPIGRGEVVLDDVVLEGRYGLGDRVELDVELERDAVVFHQARFFVRHDGGVVDVQGRLGLGEGLPLEARVGIDDLQFAKLMDQLGVSPDAIVSWTFDGGASLSGTLDPVALDGPIDVRTRDFLVSLGPWHAIRDRIVGVEHGRVAGRVRVTPDELGFLDLALDTGRTRGRVDVHLGFSDAIQVDAKVPVLDLADVTPLVGFGLAGRGSADVHVSGTYSQVDVRGRARLAGFELDDFPIGDVETDWSLDDDYVAVRFPEIRATKNESRYSVRDLVLDFADDRFEITGTVVAQTLRLADLEHLLLVAEDERFTPYQGVARGTARVRYTLGFPGDSPTGTLEIDMDLDLPEVDLDGYAFTDGALRGHLRWLDQPRGLDGAELDVERLELRKGGGTVLVSGRMELGGVLRMEVVADHLRIRDTEGLGDRLPSLGGTYSFTGEIGGTRSVPRMHLDLLLAGLRWNGASLGDGRLYVRLTDTSDPWVVAARDWDEAPAGERCAHARLGLALGRWPDDPPLRTPAGPVPALDRPMAFLVCGEAMDGRARIDLAMGWTDVMPLRGIVDLEPFELDAILREEIGEMTGAVAGRLTFTGGALLDDTLSGRVALSELRFASDQVSLANDGDVVLDLDAGRYEVVAATMRGPGSAVRLRGTGTLRGEIALRVEGAVDLGLVDTLFETVDDARGRLDLRVRLGGTIDDPLVMGEAEVRDAGFVFVDLPTPIRDLSGRVTFSSRRVILEGFEASFAGGTLAMSGTAALRDGRVDRCDVDVVMRDLSLAPSDGVELGFGGTMRLEWNQAARLPRLHGRVAIDRLRYTRPVALSPTLGELQRPHATAVEAYDPAADLLELDIEVSSSAPIRVVNNLADLDVRIDDSERPFRIVGTDQRLGVHGALTIPRGTLRFRDRQLAVERGSVTFDDATRINPSFDVLASTEIRRTRDVAAASWRIQLRAHGDLDGFRLDARSIPDMPQQDVMLLLTVGMTTAEVQQLQANDFGGTAVEALASVSGVQEQVTQALPIDDISVTTVYSQRSGRPEPQVTVGKRISDRVRLSASTSLGSENRMMRTGVEWQLSDQTSVQASYDNVNRESSSSFGNLGVDLRWRLEFE